MTEDEEETVGGAVARAEMVDETVRVRGNVAVAVEVGDRLRVEVLVPETEGGVTEVLRDRLQDRRCVWVAVRDTVPDGVLVFDGDAVGLRDAVGPL